jgi:large repetitive protein
MRRAACALTVFALIFVGGCGGCGDDHQTGIDAPMGDAPPANVVCETLPATTSGQTCDVTTGGTSTIIKGNVLTPDTVYQGGQVAVDDTGHITCTGCNCATGGETVISCPDGAVSPGLINMHDHITYTQNLPYVDTTGERYDDRQQWREGGNGHTKIKTAGSATAAQVSWGELRFLMGGATSISGSGGQKGLLRNLDQAANLEGLTKTAVDFDTFPLDDASGTQRNGDCNYGGSPATVDSLSAIDSYEPHTSEGIDVFAHNEFLCESSATYDTAAPGTSNDIAISKTSMIHGVGLFAQDYATMASNSVGLVWSPRSNISLYGDTARVEIADRAGVNISLGTDWMPSGSMNLLRELKCADSFNTTYMNSYFSDKKLWAMVTSNAASVAKMDDVIGQLGVGKVADISIFAAHGKTYRAVIDANPADVALVMRGGKVLYGDDNLVGTLATQCDQIDVCNTMKQVCLTTEVGKNYQALMTAAGAVYPAFSCDPTPMNEPTCTPSRPVASNMSGIYTGAQSATDSDGDGIPDAMDKCPNVFDPIRPMDNGVEADTDNDGIGDACDPCPLDANTTNCTAADPNDRDHDGVDNSLDNCPDVANPDQTDSDGDGKGDACDACPNTPNPGAEGCPASIYAIKSAMLPTGTAVEVQHALVTGTGTNGFFVQVKETDAGYMGSDYSGLFVFTNTGTAFLTTATVGARVTIDGSIDAFGGEIELDSLTGVTLESAGPEAAPVPVNPVAYAEVKTGGTRQAKLEGVIVQLGASTVTAFDTTFGEATLTAADTTTLTMDDFIYAALPAVGTNYASVTGILSTKSITGGSASKLQPRGPADLVLGAPGLASIGPALSYVKVTNGTDAVSTFPQALTITLTSAAIDNTTNVMLMSGTTGALTVAAMINVPMGQTTVTVPVTAIAANTDVTITAMLGTNMQTAHVRVLGAGEVPATVTLAPNDATVAINGTQVFTVTLDIPADVAKTINLTESTASGTFPTSVPIAANQVATTFTYTDTALSGSAMLTAALVGTASTSSANITVSTGANHLVINEVDYDQVGTDTAEYVEIFNPSAQTISLTGKTLYLVNGANSEVYGTIDLSSAVSMAPLTYLVIAGSGVTVPMTAKKIDPGWTSNAIQNGGTTGGTSPDGLALVDTTNMTIIDAFSYEGALTAAMLPGFTTPPSLVEGTVLDPAVADSNSTDGSLCRHPNGQDTDNANADWAFCATLSPGTANP